MSDSEFGIHVRYKYSKELRAKEGRRAVSLLHKKINAEHDDVLNRYFSTKKSCEKVWSKLPKEIQDITHICESFPETLLNEFFPLPK
jgi:hypothetical protein